MPGRHPAIAAWADPVDVSERFVTAMTLAEIERGVIAKERADANEGEDLRRWFDVRGLSLSATHRGGWLMEGAGTRRSGGGWGDEREIGSCVGCSGRCGWAAGAAVEPAVTEASSRRSNR
ncbi:MAG: hypothetical protein AB7G47_19525 [Mycolicibacterium sp.]|uniref:hypothetical protein n=1 Tax=Mycolicibacterium sp. TaxID=2320850 RepID=UPI003D11AA00